MLAFEILGESGFTSLLSIIDTLLDKHPIENLIIPFSEFIGDLDMVGHNIERFNVPFLNNDLKRKGRPVVDQKQVIDTLNISRLMYGRKSTERIKHHNLRSCAMREYIPSLLRDKGRSVFRVWGGLREHAQQGDYHRRIQNAIGRGQERFLRGVIIPG